MFLAVVASAAICLSAQSLSGRRAPSFSLPDSKFLQHDLLDHRGHWLIVDFMKTNCPHCAALARTLEQVKSKASILEIVIPPDNLATVAKFIAGTKTTSPVLFDSGQVAASYFEITPVNQKPFDTPHWFLIDPSGTIVRDWGQASADSNGWVKEFEALIARK